jgi:hypothetical protein
MRAGEARMMVENELGTVEERRGEEKREEEMKGEERKREKRERECFLFSYFFFFF